ncbi:hypothetical protein E2I00_010051, partial [Balaenoptera physalus]
VTELTAHPAILWATCYCGRLCYSWLLLLGNLVSAHHILSLPQLLSLSLLPAPCLEVLWMHQQPRTEINGDSNKPPQAIVKPQMLTHVIEGFGIQDGAEPVPHCGKYIPGEQFCDSKSFCSMTCTKRYSVNCSCQFWLKRRNMKEFQEAHYACVHQCGPSCSSSAITHAKIQGKCHRGQEDSSWGSENSSHDWLLLQTPSLVFQEGEPIVLRCHSWKNSPLNKVVFFQNGKSKTFSYLRSNFSIPQANLSHSGEYHCTGFIGRALFSSQPVTITVQGSSWSNSLSVTIAVAVVAWIAAVAIAGAIVAWFCLRRKQISANLTDAEEAAKIEAENTVTYSLLSYPEVAEEETESSDYQNHI